MAPLPDTLLALLPRSFLASAGSLPTINSDLSSLSPREVQSIHLAKRDGPKVNYSSGSRPATDFNNKGFQALFAIIGMGMVLTALWFFFWAKNGGFRFRNGDWEDYKSTVLRRKGPDGKTLSNATKSTKLGGGSVVHGGSFGASSVGYTDDASTTVSEMRQVEEGKGRAFGIRGGEGKKDKPKRKREGTNDLRDADLRDYRDERPARVGGLNRQADGVWHDYSNTGSDLGSNLSAKPLIAPKTAKDKKKEEKEKKQRAIERMKAAKIAEKNAAKSAAKTAAQEAKEQKARDKEQAKKTKEEQKKAKKSRKTETEATPSEPAMTEYPATEYPATEYPASAAPAPGPSHQSRRAPPSAAYSFTTGDDTNTVYSGAYTDNPTEAQESSYYSDYRPNADPSAFSASRSRQERRSHQSRSQNQSQSRTRHSHSASPRKQHRPSRRSEAPSDIFTQTNGNTQGTISYPCHIPGLSSAGSVGVSESVSQVGGARRGGRDVMDGYRRGGVRTVNRRDSLSDSDS